MSAKASLRKCSKRQVRNAIDFLVYETRPFEHGPVGDEKALRACIEWLEQELRRRGEAKKGRVK